MCKNKSRFLWSKDAGFMPAKNSLKCSGIILNFVNPETNALTFWIYSYNKMYSSWWKSTSPVSGCSWVCIPRFCSFIFSVWFSSKFTGKKWNLSLKLVLFSLVKVLIYADLKKVRNNSNTHCNAPSSMVIDLPYTSGTWGFMFDLSNENSFPCHGEMSVILVKPVNGW